MILPNGARLWASFASSFLLGQPPGTFVGQRLASSVVALDAQFRSGEHERGFGIIVGSAGGRRYVVTALHVVLREDDPDAGTPQVKVTFFGDQEHGRPAEISTHKDIDHDLALLYVDGAGDLPWVRDCLGSSGPNPERMNVWFLGSGGKWVGPQDPGTLVTSEPSPDKQQITAAISDVARGSSGGPLLSDRGIIGMIQSASNGTAIALSADFIRTKVRDEWKIPWELVPRTGLTIPIVSTDNGELISRQMVDLGTMTIGFDNGSLVFKSGKMMKAVVIHCQGLRITELPRAVAAHTYVSVHSPGGRINFTAEKRQGIWWKQQIMALCADWPTEMPR